jgi:acetyl-CoA carboxylase carboxyltransferase component
VFDETELEARRRRARALGGDHQVAREHARGRLTVRERIERLVDAGSFREIGTMATLPISDVQGAVVDVLPSPYVGGFATIGGRPVVVGGEDFTVNYGAPAQHLEKFKGGFSGFIEELAFEHRLPLVLLLHGAGGDVGFADAVGFTAVPSAHSVFPMAELLAVVPVVTAVLGVVGGGAGVRAVASHFSTMSRPQGMMFAAGPAIVERALGRWVDKAELGGVDVHVTRSGNVDNIAEDEDDALRQITRFLRFMPLNVDELPPPDAPAGPSLPHPPVDVDPSDPRYDPKHVVDALVDEGSWFPIGDAYGAAVVTGLARVEGRALGVLAHDPRIDDGYLDGLAADKQARFVQMCDLFHVPMAFLVNTAGVRSDPTSVREGVLRRTVRAIEAMHRTTVPVLAIHIGRCDGLAGMATSPANRTSTRVAWPTATFGDGAGLSTAPSEHDGPWVTAELFGIEEVIAPHETRGFLASWLRLTEHSIRPGGRLGPQYRP